MLLCQHLVELMVNDTKSIFIHPSTLLHVAMYMVIHAYWFPMFLLQQQSLHMGKLVVERHSQCGV